ncbi:MAG: 6-bladed beta-propeller [Gemmatimonadota bacterium]|nr:6-bladed beta-propeller [Gemmatimonadota bacterium]
MLAHLGMVVTCVVAACGGDGANRDAMVEVDTIGGVVVVRNGTGLWSESEGWQVVEEFRVGGSQWGENPDEELSDSKNTTVTLGPNGQIFVLEFATDRVAVFSGEGEFVRSFGRRGEGPGEFSWPMAMTWDGADRLWVGAGQGGRYHVFDSTGVFQKSVARPVHAAASLQHPLFWENAGSVVEEAAGEGVVLYLRTDTLGHLIDTAAVIRRLERPPALQDLLPLPTWKSFRLVEGHYVPRLRWSRAPDGMIWSAASGELRLAQTTPNGDTLRIIETSHRSAEFDAADRAVIAEGLAEAGISRDDVELVRPLVGAIHVMDDGHILVGIIERVGEASSIFDVFDPEGFFLGTVDLGFSLPDRGVPSFVGDTIIAVTPGDLDLPYLVRATIKRPRERQSLRRRPR